MKLGEKRFFPLKIRDYSVILKYVFFFIDFIEGNREGEIVIEISVTDKHCSATFCMSSSGDQAHNSNMCPERKSNQQLPDTCDQV